MNKEWSKIIEEFSEDNINWNNETFRKIVLRVYNYTCPYTWGKLNENNLHLDHFIPKSKIPIGKHKSLDNMIPSMKEFNMSKNDYCDDLTLKPTQLSLGKLYQIRMNAKRIRKLYFVSKLKKGQENKKGIFVDRRRVPKINEEIYQYHKNNEYTYLNLLNGFLEKYKNNIVSIKKVEGSRFMEFDILYNISLIENEDLGKISGINTGIVNEYTPDHISNGKSYNVISSAIHELSHNTTEINVKFRIYDENTANFLEWNKLYNFFRTSFCKN